MLMKKNNVRNLLHIYLSIIFITNFTIHTYNQRYLNDLLNLLCNPPLIVGVISQKFEVLLVDLHDNE